MILPDHPTPIRMRTHSMSPVPFLIYSSEKKENGIATFDEFTAEATGNYVPNGYTLMEQLIEK